MARAIFSNATEREIADAFAALASDDSWELRLFVEDIIPDEFTVLADLTEPTASWYSAQVITYASAIIDGGVAVLIPTPVIYTYSGADPDETIHGWFYRHPTDDNKFILRRFEDAPRVVGAGTDPLFVLPSLGFQTASAG